MVRKDLVVAVLATFCLTVIMFTVIPVGSYMSYDPWLDYNDDGKIDVRDVAPVCAAYGSNGTNITKAYVAYDSGWMNITDKAGQYVNFTHNLDITDWSNSNVMLDIMGKRESDGTVFRADGLKNAGGWGHMYQGDYDFDNFGTGMANDGNGGYAIAGYGTGDEFPFDNIDAYVIELDSVGCPNILPSFEGPARIRIDVGGDDYAHAIIQGGYGIWVVAGETTNNNDAFLFKYSDAHLLLWSRRYDYGGIEKAYDVVSATGGGYVLAGLTSLGGYDLYLVGTDSDGNRIWQRAYGGTNGDYGLALVQTSDGGYAIAGYTYSYGAGNADFWLVKTDSTGNMQWQKTYGGTNFDEAYDLVQTGDGGYAIAGLTSSFGAGSYDFWLVKTDAAGNMQWNKTYGGTSDDGAYSLVQTSDGGYAMAGYTLSTGEQSAWLVKTDDNGNFRWDRICRIGSDNYARSIIQAQDGTLTFVGRSTFFAGVTFFLVVNEGLEEGVAVTAMDNNTITLYKGSTDVSWDAVRVRISRLK